MTKSRSIRIWLQNTLAAAMTLGLVVSAPKADAQRKPVHPVANGARPHSQSGGPLLRFTPEVLHAVAGDASGFGENSYGDGGNALDASLGTPSAVAVDADGNLFIAVRGDNTVRRVNASTGIITTVAGVPPSSYGGGGGEIRHPMPAGQPHPHVLATTVSLSQPQGVAVDAAGNIFVASTSDDVIYKVDPQGEITTYAGTPYTSGYDGDGADATSAHLTSPTGLAVDAAGNLFIADTSNHVIRRVDAASGIITTVAGNDTSGYSGDGGSATSAQLYRPSGVAVDAAGNLFIADRSNYVVRRVDAATQTITTVAGSHSSGYTGDGGAATSARLSSLTGVAVDAAGQIYIADTVNSVVRLVDAAGTIRTLAGVKPAFSFDPYSGEGGPATAGVFGHVADVKVDALGNVYIAASQDNLLLQVGPGGILDFSNQIKGTSATQTVTLYNPSSSTLHLSGYSVSGDSTFLVDFSGAGACDTSGAIAPGADCVMHVTFSPTGPTSDSGQITIYDDTQDGQQTVTFSGQGTLFPANVSLTISPTSAPISTPVTFTLGVTPASGTTPVPGGTVDIVDTSDGSILTTLTLDSNGNAAYTTSSLSAGGHDYVATYNGDANYAAATSSDATVTVVPNTATITLQTSASSASVGAGVTLTATLSSTATLSGSVDFYADTTLLGSAPLNGSTAVYSATNIPAGSHRLQAQYHNSAFTTAYSNFVAIVVHSSLLQFFPAAAYTLAGIPADDLHGGFSGDGGSALAAHLHTPAGITPDGAGNLFIADEQNNVIRRVDAATGVITTVAGIPWQNPYYTTRYSGDGGPATQAYLTNPTSVAFNDAGDMFISDYSNYVIRRVDHASGVITTYAGTNSANYNGDSGPALSINIEHPIGIVFDHAGNLFLADAGQNLIRKVDTAGQMTTIAGVYFSNNQGVAVDNVPATQSTLNRPTGLAIDTSGNLFVADSGRGLIRRIDATTQIITTFAGGVYGQPPYGDGGPATSAYLNYPAQLAMDPANNLIIADTGNSLVRRIDTHGVITTVAGISGYRGVSSFIEPNGRPATITPLDSAYGVGVDAAGQIYVANTYNQTILRVGSAGSLTFGPQATGTSSTSQQLKVVNNGDLPLHFDSTPFTITGDYTVASSGTGACNFQAPLAAGADCTVDVTFTPASSNSSGGTITFHSDSGNPPSVVHLLGNQPTQPTTTSLYVNNTANYGDQVLVVGAVSGSTVTPTGSVTFFDNPASSPAVNLGSAALSSGYGYVYLTNLSAGSHSLTATYSGDAFNSASTSDPSTIVIAKAPTATGLSASASSVAYGTSVTFTATVTASSGVPVSGSVNFYDGQISLGAAQVDGSGVATFTTNSFGNGSHTVTAQYSGTDNIAASTSSAVTIQVTGGGTPDYTITASGLPVTVHRGSTATVSLTLTPLQGFQGTVHLDCGTLPSYASCTFSTADVTLVSTPQTVTLTLSTTASLAGTPHGHPVLLPQTGPHALPAIRIVP